MRLVSLVAALLVCHAGSSADLKHRKIDLYSGGGLLPQVVDSAGWKTTFYLHNMDISPINVVVFFLDDKGDPMSLPFGGETASYRTFTLLPDHTTVAETDGVGALKQGYAALFTCDRSCLDTGSKPVDAKLAAFAVFRQRVPGRPDNEAVVPLEMPEKSAHIVFDNRNGYATGIAILNFLGGPIAVTLYDENGNKLATDTLSLAEDEKAAFVLADKYPVTAGKYGCVALSGAGLAAMGLRFNPNGSFTSSHAMTMH